MLMICCLPGRYSRSLITDLESEISGNLKKACLKWCKPPEFTEEVADFTTVEDIPEDLRARAVPPVEIISTSYLQSFSASDTKSVLSDAERSALLIEIRSLICLHHLWSINLIKYLVCGFRIYPLISRIILFFFV